MRLRRAVPRMRLTVGVLLAFCFVSAAGFAQTTSKSIASTAAQRGKATFQHSCAVCHGDRGNGNGLAAAAMTPRPTDLTTLAKRKGTFPAARIEDTIKGRDSVAAHGSSGMSFWGAFFLADANGDQGEADVLVSEVVRYIESIQVK